MKPVILTILSHQEDEVTEKFNVNTAYVRAITKAGGTLVALARPSRTELDRTLTFVDGVLLVGGSDVDPKRYHERNRHSRNIDNERDAVELYLTQQAIRLRIPVLGICRGMQVMNIALGGSLYQDIGQEMSDSIAHDQHKDAQGRLRPRNLIAHKNNILPKTKLSRIIKKKTCAVNSLHHQGVKKLGVGLSASSLAPDGLIEGVEYPDHPFAIGVEWHPEELRDSASRTIFREFIRAAVKHAD